MKTDSQYITTNFCSHIKNKILQPSQFCVEDNLHTQEKKKKKKIDRALFDRALFVNDLKFHICTLICESCVPYCGFSNVTASENLCLFLLLENTK